MLVLSGGEGTLYEKDMLCRAVPERLWRWVPRESLNGCCTFRRQRCCCLRETPQKPWAYYYGAQTQSGHVLNSILINIHHSHVFMVTRWSRSPTAWSSTVRTWLCLPNCPLCCLPVVILLGDGWGLFLPCYICSVVIRALHRCCRPRLKLIFGIRICPPLRPLLSLRGILKFITTIEPFYSRSTGKPLIRICGLGIFDEICRLRFGEARTVMRIDCMLGGNWWDRLELPNYF